VPPAERIIVMVLKLFDVDEVDMRLLTESDVPALQGLCENCVDYFEHIQGYPAGKQEAQSILACLPEGKDRGDKYLVGIFQPTTHELIGVIELIRDWPHAGEWLIGLMLIEPAQRGKKVGEKAYTALSAWCKAQGAESMRVAVVETNHKAMKFWLRQGFSEIDSKPNQVSGNRTYTIVVLRQLL
jgi:GNAT superfamily N-acetyltransferase